MEFSTNIFKRPNNIINYISDSGDIQPINYTNNQKNIITKNRRDYAKKGSDNILSTIQNLNNECEKNDRYDPYKNYLQTKGLDKYCESKSKYTTHYLNVDSSLRTRIPRNIKNDTIYLNNDPILLTYDSDLMFIKHFNHSYQIGDKIAITGIKSQTDILYVRGLITNDIVVSATWETETVTGYIFELFNNSEYMKINYKHYLNIYYTGTTAQDYYINYPIDDLQITLSGFTGNGTNSLYYDNIPINIINTTHNIILKDPFTGDIYRNAFFIKLPLKYLPSGGVFVPPPSIYPIKITYNYVAGLPLNLLNADYPLDQTRYQGFFIIDNVRTDGYYVKLTKKTLGPYDPTYNNNENIYIGGNLVNVASINDTIVGDSYPNSYSVIIEPSYRNVVMIKMVSSEFPDYGKTIRSINNVNNKFYWQNYIDGDHVYSVTLPDGNYQVGDIVNSLQTLIYNTPRINHSVNASYTKNQYIRILVDSITDIVEIRAYRETPTPYPIIEINPPIATLTSSTLENVILTIQHPNHNLVVGEILLINGANDTSGIPSTVINNQFEVNSVIDENKYTIKLPYFNPLTTINNTMGGTTVKIYTPDIFRIRFDYSDTLGSIFGFRDVGEFGSITEFNTVIKNTDTYYNESPYDQNGLPKIIKNDRISLSSSNYILVTCNNIEMIKSNSPVKNLFSKILLTNKTGYIFNSFVNTNKIFTIPITELSELKFEFLTPNGELYDFNNLEHSFMLEITTIDNDVVDTGINTLTGTTATGQKGLTSD